MSNKAMGKISFIQTTLTRDVNGHCKCWSPKLCCGFFFYWRHQVKMYLIQSIHDYIQNTHNYSYNQASFKGASLGVAYQSREKEDQGRKHRPETPPPFLRWIMQRIISLIHHWFFSLSDTAGHWPAYLFC